MKRIIVINDLHVNSTVGLSLPEVVLGDGGVYHYSAQQKVLYEHFSNFVNTLIQKQQEKPAEKNILIINGDLVDLNTHANYQLISLNRAIIVRHAVQLIKPLVDAVDDVIIIGGTPAHVGESSELEELVNQQVQKNQIGVQPILHLYADDVFMQFSHFARIGSKPWSRLSSLMSLGSETMMNPIYTKDGFSRPPDLLIRGHVHTYADTYNNMPIRVITGPCWQLASDFSHMVGITRNPSIGGMFIECENGKYNVEVKLYDVPDNSTYSKVFFVN